MYSVTSCLHQVNFMRTKPSSAALSIFSFNVRTHNACCRGLLCDTQPCCLDAFNNPPVPTFSTASGCGSILEAAVAKDKTIATKSWSVFADVFGVPVPDANVKCSADGAPGFELSAPFQADFALQSHPHDVICEATADGVTAYCALPLTVQGKCIEMTSRHAWSYADLLLVCTYQTLDRQC